MSGFYLKLTDLEASQMISQGIGVLFNGEPTKFTIYTDYVLDVVQNEKYWYVQDYWYYDCESWVSTNFPTLEQYDYDHVRQFMTTPDPE